MKPYIGVFGNMVESMVMWIQNSYHIEVSNKHMHPSDMQIHGFYKFAQGEVNKTK